MPDKQQDDKQKKTDTDDKTDEPAPAGPDTSKHDEDTDRPGWRGE